VLRSGEVWAVANCLVVMYFFLDTVEEVNCPWTGIMLLDNLECSHDQTVILCLADADNALDVLELLAYVRRNFAGLHVAVFTRELAITFTALLIKFGATKAMRLAGDSKQSSLQIRNILEQLSDGPTRRRPSIAAETPASRTEERVHETELERTTSEGVKELAGRVFQAVKYYLLPSRRSNVPWDRSTDDIDRPAHVRSYGTRQDSAMALKDEGDDKAGNKVEAAASPSWLWDSASETDMFKPAQRKDDSDHAHGMVMACEQRMQTPSDEADVYAHTLRNFLGLCAGSTTTTYTTHSGLSPTNHHLSAACATHSTSTHTCAKAQNGDSCYRHDTGNDDAGPHGYRRRPRLLDDDSFGYSGTRHAR